jgi:hypothetical protein
MMFPDPFPSSTQPLMQGTSSKLPKFMEGTVYQLARALYAVHAENETQPANAIQDAIRIFVNDKDRNTILQAAKGAAEAIIRKRAIQLKTTKSQQSMTISEQAEHLKIQLIARLKSEMMTTWEASQQQDSEGTTSDDRSNFEDKYYSLDTYRQSLKEDVRTATYSDTEIEEASQRLQRKKRYDSVGSDNLEDIVIQIAIIWRQLTQALLLQKGKTHGSPPVTFVGTPSASKEPIGKMARIECGKLTRLTLENGELIRMFSDRCRTEELYCAWLRDLHTTPSTKDRPAQDHINAMSKQIDEDIDSQLFGVLSGALPLSLAYMRANVDKESPNGSKFSALRLALEGEADFLKENSAQHSKVSFLDTHQTHTSHRASDSVTLGSRITSPVSGSITESYHAISKRILKLEAAQTPRHKTISRERSRSPRRIGYPRNTADQRSFPPHVTPEICEDMFKTSICRDYECSLYHGISNRDPSVRMCKHTGLPRWCPHLWSARGCMFHHGKEYA